jgi:hypothetical protein
MRPMAFLAALPEVLAAVGEAGGTAAAEGAAGGAAGGAAEAGGTAGGSGGLGGLGNMLKSKIMPIPHMGSNGPPNGESKPDPLGPTKSVLNSDQFR